MVRKKNPVLSLVLTCYNEGAIFTDSISVIYDVLKRSGYSFEMLFVDDASHDQTPSAIKKFCREHPHVSALYHEVNQGRGASVTDGIRRAKGDIVGYIDVDCEVSPIYIPEMVEVILRKKADFVIGNRVYRTTIPSLIREILSTGYRWIVTNVLDTRGLDTESGYKFFRRSKIMPVLSHVQDTHWFWDTEIIVYAMLAGLTIQEMPVLFIRRFDKKSTVRMLRDVTDYCINLWRLRKRLARI